MLISHRKNRNQSWDVLPEFEPLLAKVLDSPGQIVRNLSQRTVTRHSVGEKTFYIKTYFHNATPFASFKYFFKTPASYAEWQIAPHLHELGIPVVPHLAHGKRWSWRGLQESTLITEGPAGFIPLKSISASDDLQSRLGQFVRQLHRHFIFHDDLHASNLLWSPATREFCLVDLDNIKIVSSLDLEQRLDNLATLHRRFPLEHKFFEAYGDDFLRYKNKLARRSDRQLRESIPKKLKLLFKNRQAFTPKKIGRLTWHVRQGSWNEQLESILNEPDHFLTSRARLLKEGPRSTVGCADGIVLKRFNVGRVSTVIFDSFRSSPGKHSFRTARHLELLKIATPQAIAFANHRQLGFITRSYFVMEEIVGAKYLWEPTGDRTALIVRLAELLAKLHHEGFSHRDLKETNLILNAQNIPKLIGLDALHYVKKVSSQRVAIELTGLLEGFSRRTQISTKERIRFIKTYCTERQISNWRCWRKKIGENLTAGKSK